MDLLAALAADPTLLPLWAMLLFAAGMYPIGMMFGCSPCCDPCACASGSTLPETITVTLDGFTDYSKKQLCTLSFSACYGSGGSGTVDAPGQSSPESNPEDDRGPITAVSLTDGGSGYAKLGRAAPTVTVNGTSGSGTGATFNVTLSSSKDSCGLDRWAVSKVTMEGGTGYQTGDAPTFAVADGDTQEAEAYGTIYAARIAPTVTVSGTSGSGTGATFNVTLAQSRDSNGLDRWAVSKVTMDGGDGYLDGDTLTFAIAEGDTQETEAAAKIAWTTYAEPTLSLSVPGGTGAVLQIDDYTKSGDYWFNGGLYDFADTWRISGITVANGGSGYTDNTQVTIVLGDGDEARPFAGSNLRARTVIAEPTGEWTLDAYDESWNPSAGSGLALSFTLTRLQSSNRWGISSASVTNGGSGYSVGDFVDAYLASSLWAAGLEITSVDQNGAVTGLFLSYGGAHEGSDTGVIESIQNLFSQAGWRKPVNNTDGVIVTNGGVYYREDENNRTITVNSGGVYYREDASLPPYVATVTVNINQGNNTPSAGAGAVIAAAVEDDPQSPDFGKITGLTVEDGGDGYLAWVWETNDCCGHYLNGQQIVLARFKDSNAAACEAAAKGFLGQYNIPFSANGEIYSVPSDCVYTTQFCGGWESPFMFGPSWSRLPMNSKKQLYVGYRGEGQRPVAKLGLHCYGGIGSDGGWTACQQDWIADDPIESCSQFSFSASPPGKPSISVSPGGTYDPDWRFSGCGDGGCPSCNVCCQGDDEPPEEIEVEINDEWTTARPPLLPDFSGTYVASGTTGTGWLFALAGPGNSSAQLADFCTFNCNVWLSPCHTNPQCKTCIKKCHVGFGLSMSWRAFPGNFGGECNFGHALSPEEVSCGDCEDTPLCNPSGKSFPLFYSGQRVATATIQ